MLSFRIQQKVVYKTGIKRVEKTHELGNMYVFSVPTVNGGTILSVFR